MTDEDVGNIGAEGQADISTSSAPSNLVDMLPEDLRAEASLKDFKDIGSLAKSYVNAQRMIGNSVRIPSNDSSKEVLDSFYKQVMNIPGVMIAPNEEDPASMEEFYNRIGRPADPAEYKLNLPEGVEIDQSRVAEFTQVAHKLGLTNKQADALVQLELNHALSQHQDMAAIRNGAEEVLKKSWGPEYKSYMDAAKAVVNVYSEKFPEEMNALVNSPAGNNPAVIAMLAELGRHMSEKGIINTNNTNKFGITPDEALEKIKEIHENTDHPYWNENHPDNKAAREKIDKLFKLAYPD